MSMQVFYTERIEGSCHRLDFAPQLRGVVAIDRLQLQYTRLGGDVVRNYAKREISEKLWQTLQELARYNRENIQFIRVDYLDMKTLNEEKQKAECQARVWKMAYNGATAQYSEKEKELHHLQILYRNHFKRLRRKNRRNRRRR